MKFLKKMNESFAPNGEVKIHCIDTGLINEKTPLMMIPGMVNCAEELAEKAADIFDRRAIFLSIRGRGKSDSPESGYTLNDQVSDISAVADFLKLDEFYLYGHSVGGSFAIDYTFKNPSKVCGLILGDYPPWYPKFSEQWRDRVLALTQHTMTKTAVEGVVRDAEMQVFIDELQQIQCPVLVLKGGMEDSLLPEDAAEVFKTHLSKCSVEILPQSGHDLFEPNAESFKNVVEKFMEDHE